MKKTKDGLYNHYKFCWKEYYNENLLKIKKCYLENRDRKKKTIIGITEIE